MNVVFKILTKIGLPKLLKIVYVNKRIQEMRSSRKFDTILRVKNFVTKLFVLSVLKVSNKRTVQNL